jgi:hypothetical protein
MIESSKDSRDASEASDHDPKRKHIAVTDFLIPDMPRFERVDRPVVFLPQCLKEYKICCTRENHSDKETTMMLFVGKKYPYGDNSLAMITMLMWI